MLGAKRQSFDNRTRDSNRECCTYFFPNLFLTFKNIFFVVVSKVRSSLVVQWLRLLAPNAGGLDLIPDLELDPTCHN